MVNRGSGKLAPDPYLPTRGRYTVGGDGFGKSYYLTSCVKNVISDHVQGLSRQTSLPGMHSGVMIGQRQASADTTCANDMKWIQRTADLMAA